MIDPTITCPNCKTEIKLTESLAAPLLEATRKQYERRLSAKDDELAEKIKTERTAIATEEAKNVIGRFKTSQREALQNQPVGFMLGNVTGRSIFDKVRSTP